jgi:hypothetical protein
MANLPERKRVVSFYLDRASNNRPSWQFQPDDVSVYVEHRANLRRFCAGQFGICDQIIHHPSFRQIMSLFSAESAGNFRIERRFCGAAV